MTPDDFRSLQDCRPFRPFRIRLDDGRTFDVVDPKGMHVGRSYLLVNFPRPGSDPPVYDRTAVLSLRRVTGVEPL